MVPHDSIGSSLDSNRTFVCLTDGDTRDAKNCCLFLQAPRVCDDHSRPPIEGQHVEVANGLYQFNAPAAFYTA